KETKGGSRHGGALCRDLAAKGTASNLCRVNERLRSLPSVDEVLARPAVRALAERVGRAATKAAVRAAIAESRERLRHGVDLDGETVPDARVLELSASQGAPRLRRVINATGVVLHTNLGRAPLHPDAIRSVAEVAGGYSNVEIDLATGRRGQRSAHLEPLLGELFGAEASHVVNNCAGATMLALAALGRGGAAIVSRGELVEIGGGFRIPEILAQSGCRLVEVGTTNRTRIADYAAALAANPSAMILRVHRSNFALVGFTETPSLVELAALAREHKVHLLHDLGSGALNVLPSELRQRATRLALLLQEKGIACSVVECEGKVGGGSLPQRKLESAGVAVEADPVLPAALREGDPPVIAIVRDGRVVLDV